MKSEQPLRNAKRILIQITLVFLLAVGAIFLHVLQTQAQGTVTWEQTQGPSGGKINVLLIDSQNPSIIYAGADGGVYTSRDGGAMWQHSSDGLPTGQEVRALTIDPTDSHILYAGTYPGVYRSINSGQTWSRAAVGLTRKLVFSLAVDPMNTSVIYAGTNGQVFKSIDGGNEWSASSEGLPEETVWSLVMDYVTTDVLYAGTDSGVFKSTNGGQQWQRASNGMPEGLQVQALAIDPLRPSVLYAATEAGVYRSTDAADGWQAANEGIGESIVHSLAIDPYNTTILYAAVGTHGVRRSTDSGETWEPTGGDINELVLTLAINPLHSQVIYAGTGRGVYYSSEAGQRWEPRNGGLINTNVLLLVAVPQRPRHLYAATGLDVHKTTDDGQTWVPINEGLARPNVLTMAVDPLLPDTLYAGTWYSEIYQSIDSGSTWRLVNGGLARGAQINALVIQRTARARSDQTSGVLYAGTNGAGVFNSTDGGVSWTAVNNGLDDLHVQVLALAPTEGGILYAGTSSSIYHLNLDSGTDPGRLLWQPAQHGLPREEVHSIVVDERSPNVIYAATATGTGEIYRSTDGGSSWTAIGRGSLPTNIKIQALAINPSRGRPNTLYASTDGGVFRSEDGGSSWRAINDGLPPHANVLTILVDVKRSCLYASINNGGVYRGIDAGTGLISWSMLARVILAAAALAMTFFAGRWFLQSSQGMQDQVFERNWPLWREEIRRILQNQNDVKADTLVHVPTKLRIRALQQYVQEHRDDNLVLRLDPPVLEPANSLQVSGFLRNWRAAQESLKSVAAFRPAVSRIADQLCQLLGFTLLDTRSYKELHGYVIKAPALRLKVPPTFPIVFTQKHDLVEQDVDDLRDLMRILNGSSYLALLVVPDNETSAGRERGPKTRFERLTRGMAHDFVVMDFGDLYGIFVAKDPEKRFTQILLRQVDLTVVSPYVTSGPVPENMFFGRDYELKTITRTIKDNSFAIVGGRRIGKTSILTKLHRLFTDATDYYSLYLNCQSVQNYRDFCDAIDTTWKLSLPDCSPENLRWFVARMKQKREGQRIVILLDEVDALLKYDTMNQERLFKALRALSQESYCRFVFCGERVLYASLHHSSSAFFNFCNVIQLSYLNHRDTGRIVLEPMQEMGIGFEDASKLIQEVIDLSACHPSIVQYICQELITLLNARGDRLITLTDLDTIGGSSQFREHLIEVMWGNTTALERLITLLILDKPSVTFAQIEDALREHGAEVSTAAMEQALDGLILCSVLNREDQEYYFMAPAFPSVITATQDVKSLVQETIQHLRSEGLIT